jgi:hypothetical protein
MAQNYKKGTQPVAAGIFFIFGNQNQQPVVLRIFQTNQILAAVLLLPYLALFYGAVFLEAPPMPAAQHGVLSQVFIEGLQGWPDRAPYLFSMLLVFFQAILLVLLVNDNRINNDSNLLPGVFYCLFAGMIPEFMYPSPALLANTFLLFALIELMAAYKAPVAEGRLFNTGLWISLASLFYFSALGLVVFAFWAVATLRAYKIREHIVILLGALTPYFLVATVFYLLDRLPEFLKLQFGSDAAFFDFQSGQDGLFYIKTGIFSILVLIVLLGSTGFFQKKVMQVQKKISILYGFLLFTGIAVLFQGEVDITHWLLAVIPLAAFFSMSFSTMPTQWAEVVHLLMLAGGLALAYSPWLFRDLS